MKIKKLLVILLLGVLCLSLLGCSKSESTSNTQVTDSEDTSYPIDEFYSLSTDEQIATYNNADNKTAYKIIEASNCSWCVTAYDLITPENVKDFVIIYANDDGTTSFNLCWPIYGGYEPETIASIKELSGEVDVSRVGGDGGYCICYGKNEDGSEYTMSQRSVPVSSSEATVGVMDIDLYKQSVEIIISDNTDEEKINQLKEIGIDEEAAQSMLTDYDLWHGRSEIAGENNIQDGVAAVGHTVEAEYGYYGKAIKWEVSGLTLVGGSGQMNTVYSWGTLKSSGIVKDIKTVTID